MPELYNILGLFIQSNGINTMFPHLKDILEKLLSNLASQKYKVRIEICKVFKVIGSQLQTMVDKIIGSPVASQIIR